MLQWQDLSPMVVKQKKLYLFFFFYVPSANSESKHGPAIVSEAGDIARPVGQGQRQVRNDVMENSIFVLVASLAPRTENRGIIYTIMQSLY